MKTFAQVGVQKKKKKKPKLHFIDYYIAFSTWLQIKADDLESSGLNVFT